MPDRLDIPKTHKLFIAGAFPRSESGRTFPVHTPRGTVHMSLASRKDLRAAAEAARAGFEKWRSATPYNRGQVIYRMAEMLEGRRQELIESILAVNSPAGSSKKSKAIAPSRRAAQNEVNTAIDRLVCFGGWADKYAQVLGCNNPVAGPYYNFTVPEPTGIVGIIAPDQPALLGLISLIAPPLCAGNAIIALASETSPLAAILLAEICSTSDVPPGVINILTGKRDELVPHFASHREINALSAESLPPDHARILRAGAADNLKRVTIRATPRGRTVTAAPDVAHESPWTIEPFVEFKTIWHPSGA